MVNSTGYHDPDFRYTLHAPFVAFLFLLLLLGVPGNLLSFCVYQFRWPQTSFSIFMRFLVIYDLLNLLIVVPLAIADRLLPMQSQALVLCRAYHGSAYCLTAANGLLMLVIAAERYMKICRLSRGGISAQKAWGLCVVCAFSGSVACVPYFRSFHFRRFSIDIGSNMTVEFDECNIGTLETSSPWIFIYFGLSGVLFVVVCTLLVVAYVKIGLVISNQRRRRRNMTMTNQQTRPCVSSRGLLTSQPSTDPKASSTSGVTSEPDTSTLRSVGRGESNRPFFSQTTRVSIALTSVFLLTFVPYFAEVTLQVGSDFEKHQSVLGYGVHQLFFFFPLMNSVTNSVVYGFMSAQFRKECKHLLTNLCSSLQSTNSSSSQRERSDNVSP